MVILIINDVLWLQKAKADNKFFAAMREKEAVENEHKHLARTNEKLLKHVSNLTDVEKANANRLVCALVNLRQLGSHLVGRPCWNNP
jgi:BRE1 E3 ubiquitin ligase